MMSKTMSGSRWRVVAVMVVLLALLAGACSSSDDGGGTDAGASATTAGDGASAEKVEVTAPGVTGEEIRYSILSTGSGNPTGQCLLQCYTTGIQAYFDYVNAEKDGIFGRELVAEEVVDDEMGKNQEKALGIIAADDTFGTFSAAVLPTGFADFAAEGIPLYVWATNPVAMQGLDSIWGEYTVRCLEVGCWQRSVPYQMKISGRTKLASIGYGIAQSSKDCAQNTAQSVEVFKDQIGGDAEAVYVNDELPFGLPNGVAPEVTAMKNAGANALSVCIVNNDTKTIMQEAKRQGLDVVPIIPQGYDDQELTAMGGLFDGGHLRLSFRPFEADLNEAQEKYLEYSEKHGGPVSEVTIYGWINAALAYEGLKLAGPDFSREKVVEATNTLTAFTADGFTFPMDWTTGHEAPTPDDLSNANEFDCYGMLRIEDSEFVLEGDPSKPFVCWPGDTWDWDEGWPQNMNFE